MNEVAIQESKLPKLRPGPMELYLLFHNSVAEKRVIKRDEIFFIYKEYVASGKGYAQVLSKDRKLVWVVRDWMDWQWEQNFNNWFIRTLGSLLKKGYLRVVPAVDLTKCSEKQLGELGITKNVLQQPLQAPPSAPAEAH